MKLIDLCYPMYPDMHGKDRPPHANMSVLTASTVEHDGMAKAAVTIGAHAGTHIDGPAHLVKGGKTLDQLPLETFYGTGLILDMPKGPDEAVTLEEFKSHTEIKKGDIILVHTGWDRRFKDTEYYQRHPYIANDAALWLVKKGVKMVGADLLSPDLPWSLQKKDFKYTTLMTFLENNVPVLLNLTNLKSVVGKRVNIMALPINFRQVDSGPARAVAVLED